MTVKSKKIPTKRRSLPLRRTSLKNRTTRNPLAGVPLVLPKTRGFKVLSGDVNWKKHGRIWYKSLGDGTYYILEFINFEEATGKLCKGQKYCVVGSSIDLSPGGWSLSQISQGLQCIGAPQTRNPLVILEGIYCYSGGDREFQMFGNNADELLAIGKLRL